MSVYFTLDSNYAIGQIKNKLIKNVFQKYAICARTISNKCKHTHALYIL